MSKCYFCSLESENNSYFSEYILKENNNKINVCVECENDNLTYFDKIRRLCLIDGISYETSRQDEKFIEKEKRLRQEQEEQERLISVEKQILYFTNKQGKNLDNIGNHQAIKFANEFLNNTEDLHNIDIIQRMKYSYSIGKQWNIQDKKMGELIFYLDSFKNETYQSRKDKKDEWKEHIRTWYSGCLRVVGCDLYDTTFGFCTYDNKKEINDIYFNYKYICSKTYYFKLVLKDILEKEGWLVNLN